jgi:NAD(P)-dependent dehydrogenase (short-subunit alcohol dehydrogenase family)
MPPHSLLTGLTAAITGGTTGIGRAIALEFLRQGCNVAINHLNLTSDAHHVASLISLAAEIKEKDSEAGRLIEVEGDVSKPETGKELVERAVKEFGGLDVFVSNAGVCQFAEFLECVSLFVSSSTTIFLLSFSFSPFSTGVWNSERRREDENVMKALERVTKSREADGKLPNPVSTMTSSPQLFA